MAGNSRRGRQGVKIQRQTKSIHKQETTLSEPNKRAETSDTADVTQVSEWTEPGSNGVFPGMVKWGDGGWTQHDLKRCNT